MDPSEIGGKPRDGSRGGLELRKRKSIKRGKERGERGDRALAATCYCVPRIDGRAGFGLGQGTDWRPRPLSLHLLTQVEIRRGWDVSVLILILSVFEPVELTSKDPCIRYLRGSVSRYITLHHRVRVRRLGVLKDSFSIRGRALLAVFQRS